MPTQQLKLLNSFQLIKYDQQKLLTVETKLNQLTKEIVNKDIELIQNQSAKITKFSQQIRQIQKNIINHSYKCTNRIKQLQNQVNQLECKIKDYMQQFSFTNKQKQYKRVIQQKQNQYLFEWKKRIQLSNKINTEQFLKVNIQDRKSKANQVFKWIIVTIYGESESKYYWPNFKYQVFKRDQGKDFKQRLGKINPTNIKQQAKIKTNLFIDDYNQIIQTYELNKVKHQIQKIHNIAQIFLKCHQIFKQIKQYQSEIEKSKEKFQEKDQEAMRWKARSQALQDRIKTNKEFLNILTIVGIKLNGKAEDYNEKQNISKQVIQKLKKQEQVAQIIINFQDEKRDLCKCSIF